MYLNKLEIIGNLTRDPELKALPSGSKVCNLSIATNYVYKDASGEKQETVEYHNVTFYGKMAETIAQYCEKGQQLYVCGRLQTRSWEKDGVKQYRTECIANEFQFGKRAGDGNGSSSAPKSKPAKPKGNDFSDYDEKPPKDWKSKKTADRSELEYPSDEINPDDIPF